MANHTENSLRCPGIFEVLNLLLAIPAFETGRAEGLIPGEDCKILDLVPTSAAAICTVVADERPVTKEEKVCVRVEECATRIAPETVYMPSIARCQMLSITASQRDHTV